MSERGCIKCGYILTGLPAAGTIVSCPECGHANDLAIPLRDRVYTFAPLAWGLVPMALCEIGAILEDMRGGPSFRGHSGVVFLVALLGGALTTAVLTYRLIGREPALGEDPRPHLPQLTVSVLAGTASVAVNVLLVWVVWMTIKILFR